MKWPLFENKIGKELSDHRSEVDVDALWSAIEPEVDRINAARKKKRRGILWFWFAGMMVLGTGIGFFVTNNGTDTAALVEEIAIEEVSTQELTTDKTANEKEFESEQENELQNSATLEKNEPATPAKTDKGPISISTQKEPVKPEISISTNIGFSTWPISPSVVLSEKNETDGASSELGSADDNSQEAKTETRKRKPETIAHLAVLPTPYLYVEPGFGPSLLQPNGVATSPDENSPDLVDVLEQRHPAAKKPFRYSVSARAGVGYADRRLAALADSIGGDYLKQRESTEKILETVQAGLFLNARHRSGLEASIGFHYSRSTELFEIQNILENTDSIPGIKYYAVNPNNDTIPVFGMVPHLVTVEMHKKYYNRYTLLDVPVLVGYHFKNGNWTLGGEAGVFANLSLKTSGRFLSQNGADVDIEPLFKTNVGLSYHLGFSANFQAGENLEIGLSPYIRHFPKNFAEPSNTLSQKYTIYGINAGARFWF